MRAAGSRHEIANLAGKSSEGPKTSQKSRDEDQKIYSEDDEEEEEEDVKHFLSKIPQKYRFLGRPLRYTKILLMVICWLIFTYFLMTNKETGFENITLTVPPGKEGSKYTIEHGEEDASLYVRLSGAFIKSAFTFDEIQISVAHIPILLVELELVGDNGSVKTKEYIFQLYLADHIERDNSKITAVEEMIENIHFTKDKYRLHFHTNVNETLPLQMAYMYSIMSTKAGLILASILLFLMYVPLIFELVHRTVAGIICSTLAIGIVAAVHMRPSQQVFFNEWGNIDTVMLFFGVSIVLELLLETGLQDYLATLGYELANGHIWPMLHCVLLLASILSNVFDAILLVMFIAPICLRLCEIMELNCAPVLSALIIFINVGSSLSPINSITNNIIINSPHFPKGDDKNENFMLHMLPATLLALLQSYLQLRLQFQNSDKMRSFEPYQVRRIKRLISVWRRASMAMGDYTWDDTLARITVARRIENLRQRLRRFGKMPVKPEGFETTVNDLKERFPIKKPFLLTICLLSLFITLLFNILAGVTELLTVSKGWTAILAALLAISLTCYEDIEGMLTRIDWSTMLFFVTLSIIMQVLIALGLLNAIGIMLESFIIQLDESNRLTVAILVIIWISAILTTFIDNVPVAHMMMGIIGTLAQNENIKLPIMPLVWSLALGCAFGGNGSLVAAVGNIACAGLVTRHGYKLRFLSFLKIGFLVMLGNVTVASCYLLLAHVGFHWH